ncbi:MAG: C10 family peptidase [Kiritimatiellae bacterium]|nr:C10 family peptidase [Kiritimatiellia bacterium]
MKRIFSLIALTATMCAAIVADAAALSENEAGIAASRWARRAHLGVRLAEQRSSVRRYVTSRGGVFYGVQLGRSGSVVVADVGGRARVVAFSRQPLADIPENSPLYALVSSELSARAAAVGADAEYPVEKEMDIDDLRVSPFVETKWGQGNAFTAESDDAGVRCYNRYTPDLMIRYQMSDGTPIADDDVYASPCGCVATAMAQTMRYWQWPEVRQTFTNTVTHRTTPYVYVGYSKPALATVKYRKDNIFVNLTAGRDELYYAWDKMIENPLTVHTNSAGVAVWDGDPVDDDICDAIGSLCYDCGVAVGMEYDYDISSIYSNCLTNIPLAVTNTFGYASAVLYNNNSVLTRNASARARTILANLDAKRPAILIVTGPSGGHAVVADGYGFTGNVETPYVHLNMGWDGQCDIWYNLPTINVSDNPEKFAGFGTILGVVYNITPDPAQVGEIVSGRVTGPDGAPVANLEVEACDMTGSQLATTTTDEHGVYHFVLPPNAVGYDLFAKSGELVGDAYSGPVVQSADSVIGNSWGNDMVLGLPNARAGARCFREFRRAAEYAQRAGEPLVEVLRPCTLKGTLSLFADLAIVATNQSPRQSPVVCIDGDGGIEVVAGTRLVLSNIVFDVSRAGTIASVNVASGGAVAVSGTVVVDSVSTADAAGFELAGPLESGIELKCSAARDVGSACGVVSFDGAASYAAYVFNGYAPTLAGVVDGDTLRWGENVPVPPEAAYAVFSGESGTFGFRTLDQLLAYASGSGELRLLRRCRFASKAEFADDILLTAANGGGLFSEGGAFTVLDGATLTVSNIAVAGSAPGPLITLGASKDSRGFLVLANGASIEGYANTARGTAAPHGGAVSVQYGTAQLLAGSIIDGCTATYAGLRGGGVYLKSGYSELELGGGAISNCVAGGVGAGVYAASPAKIDVTGPSAVVGNVYRNADGDTASDVYLDGGGVSRFVLKGDAAGGLIGVSIVSGSVGAPSVGDAFMAVDAGAQAAAASADAFFSNDAELVGAVSEDASQLVWVAASEEQCSPDRAVAFVVYAESGETNYYPNVNTAFANIRGDATVYVAVNRDDGVVASSDWDFVDDVEIVNDVTLCTVGGTSTRAVVYRDRRELLTLPPARSLFVRPGGSLTLTNIVLSTSIRASRQANFAMLAVDGGTLVMEEGAEIYNVCQKGARESDGNRAAGAVNVYNDGVFRMRGGIIRECENYHWSSESDYSVGAGVLVDNATAYFEGGSVVNCTAWRYAGVYVGNRGKAYVGGAFSATGNKTYSRQGSPVVTSNFAVQDLSLLVLTAPLSGSVGITDGVKASTNVFGEVGCELTPEVAASATNFVHDTNGETGAVATNAEGRAFLVWPSAFPDGEDSFEEDGVVYYRVETTPPPPPGYTIHYVGGDGATGSMDDSFCLYGKVYNLRKCTLSKGGARFAGWAWNGRLYDDGILIFNLSDVPGDELDFVAVWVDE